MFQVDSSLELDKNAILLQLTALPVIVPAGAPDLQDPEKSVTIPRCLH